MTLQLAACHDRARWNDFVNASPQGNVFCLTPFLDALDEDYELLVVEDEGDLQLGAVLIKKDGQPIRAPYPFALYHGVLLSQRLWELPQHRRVKRYMEVIDFLLAELEGRFDRISFCLHYRIA